MGFRSQWRCAPAVAVRTAAGVTAIFYLLNHSRPDHPQERTYTASAAVTSVWKRQWLLRLGKRAPAFTSEELEKLVDGVLPQYALLYGPPDQQVSAHQKVDIWRAIAKEVRALGVHNRRGTHCRKRWEDIRRGTRKTAESLLGMASQRRRGASRTLTPVMSRILAVA
ncbi:hypothetical protein NDU88_000480 [Pleurodeles waltl]|uniref:Myb-like domain-containing protein n=1 Tax=Pleurodeles waltl TaxID=8319 RepID=A0AAV7SWT3_PLEWA|nr:hypothetical protein NDU88_000480 [Pleurodeles waltl]